jgi:hypothetical membrane protein
MNRKPTMPPEADVQQRVAGGHADLAPDHDPGRSRAAKISGLLMVCAGAAILLGIITAESLFPASISTSQTTISALGSTWNPGGIVHQPSATVFNTTMLVTGAMIVASAVFLYRASRRRGASIAVGILGLGVLLVGLFHGEMVDGEPSSSGVHPVVSIVSFVAGAAAALLASRVVRGPSRYVSAAFGLIALLALLLQGPLGDGGLGDGGVERWVAYPTVLWLVAFGGYLLGAWSDRDTAAGGAW